MSDVDRKYVAGIGQDIKGQVEQVVGRLRGDAAQQSKGLRDEAEGQDRQGIGDPTVAGGSTDAVRS